MTRSRSWPHRLAMRSAPTLATPPGSAVLTPVSHTSEAPGAGGSTRPRFSAQASTGRSPCRRSASCRAVGWSKTSVLGNITPSPADCCSWLRNSTAPSESTPASISGASASTAPTAMLITISSTVSSEAACLLC
eukprot:7385179-Prymnesium_polylepis.3